METMYDRIYKLRKELNMTQEELAKKTGYSDKTAIAKIEKGKVDIPQSKIVAFADALTVSAGYLFDGERKDEDIDVSSVVPLSRSEIELIYKYRKLSDISRAKIEERLNTLLENE